MLLHFMNETGGGGERKGRGEDGTEKARAHAGSDAHVPSRTAAAAAAHPRAQTKARQSCDQSATPKILKTEKWKPESRLLSPRFFIEMRQRIYKASTNQNKKRLSTRK